MKAKYDAGRDERRRSYFSRVYGLSMEDFTTLMRSQKDRCAACKLPFSEAKDFWPCVDHDHATGQVRGLLCRLCNLTLGDAHDNPEVLRGLLRYLQAPLARPRPAGRLDPGVTVRLLDPWPGSLPGPFFAHSESWSVRRGAWGVNPSRSTLHAPRLKAVDCGCRGGSPAAPYECRSPAPASLAGAPFRAESSGHSHRGSWSVGRGREIQFIASRLTLHASRFVYGSHLGSRSSANDAGGFAGWSARRPRGVTV